MLCPGFSSIFQVLVRSWHPAVLLFGTARDPQVIRSNVIMAMSLVAVMATPAASNVSGAPEQPSREQAARVDELSATGTTKDELTNWLGIPPNLCISSSSSVELCEWRLSDREKGWEDLAEAIDTNRRVAMICALPRDGSARSKSSCVARPRLSNKREFNATRFKRKEGIKPDDVRTAYQKLAQRWIDDAVRMVPLSFLLGGVPDRCEPASEGTRSCLWVLDNTDQGHGTVATALGTSMRKHEEEGQAAMRVAERRTPS
jgi:hypothetical protein